MNLKQLLALLRSWLWIILLAAIVAGATTYYFRSRSNDVYRSTATLIVNPSAVTTDTASLRAGEDLAVTYVERILNRPILEETLVRIPIETTVEALSSQTSVNNIRNTQLIRVTVEDENPELAALLANTISQVFIERNEEQQGYRFVNLKESLLTQLETLDFDIATLERNLFALDPIEDEAEFTSIQLSLSQKRSSYETVLGQYDSVRISEATSLNSLLIDDPATPASKSLDNYALELGILAGLFSGLFAIGLAFLFEFLDQTIKTPSQIEDLTDVTSLGFVSDLKKQKGPRPISLIKPLSQAADSYRLLRTNLDFVLASQSSSKTVVITSSNKHEGKTTTISNLAVVQAQSGKKVILIDADLRRPSINKVFGLANHKGLTNAFLELSPDEMSPGVLNEYLQDSSLPNLQVMTSGPLPPNPTDLLGSEKMEKLLEVLHNSADLILIDSPPILAVPDAVTLNQFVAGYVLVISAGDTSRTNLKHSIEQLEKIEANNLGIFINRLSARNAGYYYYYQQYNYDHYSHETQKGLGGLLRRSTN